MKKAKSKVEVEERKAGAKPKMAAEQNDLLAAAKSLDADVERTKEIAVCSEYVLRELCKSCGQTAVCKDLNGLPMINCRMSAIMGVSIGMIKAEHKSSLEAAWERMHRRMVALKANTKGGAK